MGLETVLERIRDTGQQEAAAIVEEARRERERLLAEARAEGQRLRERREAEAREQAERRRVQDLARAELDAKKIVLAAQAEVLTAVQDRVKARLAASSNPEALRKLLTKYAADWKAGRGVADAQGAPALRRSVGGELRRAPHCIGG